MDDRPTLAVIVEWENADDIPETMALANLINLGERLVEGGEAYRGAPQLVMACDPEKSSRAGFLKAYDAMKARFGNALALSPLEVPNSEYLDQKIAGVAASSSDIVIFADSDVAYRPDWLARLLAPLSDPAVDYAHGRNVMTTDTIWGRAACVYWFYPMESEVADGPRFVYFSNLAMRRSAYERYPFPGDPGTRVACAMWTRNLPASGLKGRPTMATGDHPPALGFAALVAKAVEYGAIDDGRYAARAFSRGSRFLRGFIRLLRETVGVLKRTPYVSWRLGVRPYEPFAFLGLGLTYAVVTGVSQMTFALTASPKTPRVGAESSLAGQSPA